MASHPNLVHVDDVPVRERALGELHALRRRLAAAAGAHGIGTSRWDLPPGARSTPPHVHADEEEVTFVLRGGGLAWLDGTTHELRAGDCLWHLCDGEAHTLIAGPDGLDVLVFAEGSRTHLTFLPRAGQFWAGARWVPADSPHPFQADVDLGPLEVPPPSPERPPCLSHLDEIPGTRYDDPGYEGTEKNVGRHLGRRYVGLRHVVLDPGATSCPPHVHQTEEECFYVLGGDGVAVLGEEEHPLRPGSFLVRPPGTGVPHALRAGEGGLEYLAFGTHRDGELVWYPRSGKLLVGGTGGVAFEIEPVDLFEGEHP